MIGLKLKRAKSNFFDRNAIKKRLTPAERRVLSKFGSFVRKRSRTSIKFSPNTASPGNPPKAHTKDKFASLRNILFAFDPYRKSVVIGPVLLRRKRGTFARPVPDLLESGGSRRVDERREVKGVDRRDSKGRFTKRATSKWVKTGRKVTARYRKFSFMGPAFETEKKESLPKLWRNAI